METKICTKCNKEYPATDEYFYKNKYYPDGLARSCKQCDSNRAKIARDIKNKEKYKSQAKLKAELKQRGTKICTKCSKELPANPEYFYRDARSEDGLRCECKICQQAQYAIYYENKHREEKELKLKEQNVLKAEGMKICSKCNRKLPYDMFGYGGSDFNWCNNCYKEYKKNYQELNKERKRLYDKQYRETHKEQGKLYRINNHEKIKLYRLNNADKIKEYNKQRYENNKIGKLMSNAMCYALKGSKSGQHWEDLVPYNLEQLKQHLESQFTPSMNWNNYGSYWEVDHIIPQNLFKFESYTDREFQICWSLNNLRPLEKYLNRQRPKDGSDVSDDIRNRIMKG